MIKKIAILIVLFIILFFFVYNIKIHTSHDKIPINNCINEIVGFKVNNSLQLSPSHFDMLNLDDYLFIDYEGTEGTVNLYVGYYFSSNKAYASHSPLICYPSQGWKITSDPKKNHIRLGTHSIYYIETAASNGIKNELIFFWYQAYLKTNYSIYQNKIDMGYNKLLGNSEEHAFIRISTPFIESNYDKKREYLLLFLNNFYPHLIDYITNCN